MYCTKCGAELLPNANFCTRCGNHVNSFTRLNKIPVLNPTTNIRFQYQVLKRLNGHPAGDYMGACPYWEQSIVAERVLFFFQTGNLTTISGYDILPTLTIAELKPILSQSELPVSGKKSELIQRIKQHFSEDQIRVLTQNKTLYALTEKGKQKLEQLRISMEKAEYSLYKQMYHFILQRKFGDAYALKVSFEQYNVFKNPFAFNTLSGEDAYRFRMLIDRSEHPQIAALCIIGDMMGYGRLNAKGKMLKFAQKEQLPYSMVEISEYLTQIDLNNQIYIQQQEIQSYIDAGISYYQISAVLDERTCPVCGALDGRIFPISSAQIGVNFPPFHENCRCTTVMVFDDETKAGWRRARNPITGESEIVPRNVYYSEWIKKYQ